MVKIKIDTREQLRLEFLNKSIKEVIVGTLNIGDYCAVFDDGFEPPFVFERKSLIDLYGTLSAGYERFRREIDRAKEQNIQLIIIVEASLAKVLRGTSRSMRNPESIVRQLFTLRVRHGVETVFCKDRDEMAEYISQFYIAHYKEYQDKLKENPKCQTQTNQT